MDERSSLIESGIAGIPRNHRARQRLRARRVGTLATVAAALTGCQSYEPVPLNPEEHHDAWHARTLEDGSLREFLDRLDGDLSQESTGFDPDDGLDLHEGQLVALVFNPGLRIARLRVGKAEATAENSGLWSDPQFSLSVLRVTESVPDPWIVTPALTFSIPLSGRLAAERELADAEQRVARQRVLEAEWSVWYEVRRAWIEWSAARLRVEETERLVDGMDALVRTASKLAESGELPRTEGALFHLEQAQRRNQLWRLRGDVDAAEQRLRALMGLAPEAPALLIPSLALPAGSAETHVTPAMIAERNPGLARLREEYEVAEESLRHEIKKQFPDLVLGPQFESDRGQSSIGLLGGIPLPFLNANRQAIAEARVEREIARATFEVEYESLIGRWAAASVRAEALTRQRADLEEVLVPLIDRQLEDAMRLMSLGEGTSLVLLESITRGYQAKLELIETRSTESLARAELEFLTGPPIVERPTDAPEETP